MSEDIQLVNRNGKIVGLDGDGNEVPVPVEMLDAEVLSNAHYASAYDGADGGDQIQSAIGAADADAGPNIVVVDGAGPDDVSASSGSVSDPSKAGHAWSISSTPELPDNTTLILIDCYLFVEDGADTNILRNAGATSGTRNKNITIEAFGDVILDGNSDNQTTLDRETGDAQYNIGLWFYPVDNLTIRGRPVVRNTPGWGVTVEDGSNWEIDVEPDQNANKPNMDGVHLLGPCSNADVTVRGHSGDDLFAVNSTDPDNFAQGSGGPVSDVIADAKGSSEGAQSLIRIWADPDAGVVEDINVERAETDQTGGAAIKLGFGEVSASADQLRDITIEGVEVRGGGRTATIVNDCSNISISGEHHVANDAIEVFSGVTVNGFDLTDFIHAGNDASSGLPLFNKGTLNDLKIDNLSVRGAWAVISNDGSMSGLVRDVSVRDLGGPVFNNAAPDQLRIAGDTPPMDVTILANIEGSEAYNNGTTGTAGPAFNDGSGWISLVDGTSI